MTSLRVVAELSFVLSSLLFFIYIDTKKLFKNDRIINSALIHSVISGLGTNIGLLLYPSLIYDFNGTVKEMPQIFLLIPFVSFSYSFYDVYIGFKSKQIDNIIHGVFFCAGCIGTYHNDIMMSGYLVMGVETSSIFLNLRPLKKKWIDITFIVTFFLFRLVISPYLTLMYMVNPENNVKKYIFAGAFTTTLLNIYWFYYIVKKAIRMHNEEKEKEKERHNLKIIEDSVSIPTSNEKIE